MAGKPELSATPGVQNVVVYVSNDNFAQAYTVGQNVAPSQYPAHPMVGPPSKLKPHEYVSEPYFLPQNGFPGQPLVGYHHNPKAYTGDVLSSERQAGPGRPPKVRDDCEFVDGYVTVMGAEPAPPLVPRCDSVRSETAESSCSSLSSADEGLGPVQNAAPDMVVYDSSVSVRPPGGAASVVYATVPTPMGAPPPLITVPHGWKRLINNGAIIYISPSNTALSSTEQVKEYLLTAGTCKCGLDCHFKYDNTFNFDPKVASKPWTLSPDTNTGDLTKLCNHKRKMIAMASLDCKPPDNTTMKIRKEGSSKKSKRKIGMPYGNCTVPLSQIFTRPEKHQHFNKDPLANQSQVWPQSPTSSSPLLDGRLQSYHQENLVRYQEQQQQHPGNHRLLSGSPMVVGDNGTMMVHQTPNNISQQPIHPHHQSHPHQLQTSNGSNQGVHVHQQHIIAPNGQVISVQAPINSNQVSSNGQQAINQIVNTSMITNTNNGVVIQQQGHNVVPAQSHPHRVFINSQPNEPSGPGRPNIQMMVGVPNQRQEPNRLQHHQQQQQFYNYQQQHQYEGAKQMRPAFLPAGNQLMNGFRPQNILNHPNNQIMQTSGPVMISNNGHNQQKMWHNRMPSNNLTIQNNIAPPMNNTYERVPPLHQHTPTMWQPDEIKRKKVKLGKSAKNRSAGYHMMECQPIHAPCPNIDVRQITNENGRSVIINHIPQNSQNASSPSFMEDPSGYLAQQTALLNNTINRQTGANGCGIVCSSPVTSSHNPLPNSQINEVPLPSNVVISHSMKAMQQQNRTNQSLSNVVKSQVPPGPNIVISQQYNQMMMSQAVADSSVVNEQHVQCQGCIGEQMVPHGKGHSRPNSQPGTPSSLDDPVTSSTYSDKGHASPDSRPIQGGTVSTSNVSPMDSGHSDPPTPNPTPPQRSDSVNNGIPFAVYNQHGQIQQVNQVNQSREICSSVGYHKGDCCGPKMGYTVGVVTTMASGRTVGSNTITSVLAGRANTATVSINTPPPVPPTTGLQAAPMQTHSISMNVSKSPLEMVQSVVSSIQVPHSQHMIGSSGHSNSQISPPHMVKHSPTGLPHGHILVSSGGQLIMANTGHSQANVMPPPPPKLVSNNGAMPPISVSPMITNVTGAVSQVIPAVAQQVLGQQTVLVNTLPAPFVLQPGMTMTMDGGMTVGQNMQLPQLVAGNVIQQQIQIESDPRRNGSGTLLSPETGKKKGKKRKMSSQTVANMLHIAAQQNSGVVMSQQGFPQQIQMAHSPQPVMQALTIVPSKSGGPPQIVMNGQANHLGAQQLIANSQPTQQINLLQPVNLINGATGVMQNFPTIQQFIVPNLGGMVMNADGTATLLQDTSNLGMQLQLQNVNGQNVLTPVQNFNGGQSILTASPAGMVIRAPTNSQGKLIQQQQHSPGAQFLSPNGGQFVVNGAQFGGQLSPLVASVSPSQQVTFNTSPSQMRPANGPHGEYIQCGQMGQTLMVPCTPTGNIAVSSSNQNTTFVQQNTTIVQQQTTMVSNNGQQALQSFQGNGQPPQPQAPPAAARTTTLNVDQNFIISSNDNKQVQAMLVQRGDPVPQYRQSVSTQTAVNQNAQTVTTFCQTSTLSAGSPPDTTTHSPHASSGGQSPHTADTTTHSGSTDDGLSPAPSNCSATCDSALGRQPSCTMAMVHCISSSEPDSADLNTQSELDWSRQKPEMHYAMGKKSHKPPHLAYAESGLQFLGDHVKAQEAVVSSHNFDGLVQKRKSSDTLLVMETHHMHSSLFDEEKDSEKAESAIAVVHKFVVGDLVWGPAKTCPAWPGKIVQVDGDDDEVSVKWFGSEKLITKLGAGALQTLTEGLDAHHHARKKYRTSRKLNAHLEKAIQEAMAELDKASPLEESSVKMQKATSSTSKKPTNRLRSGHR